MNRNILLGVAGLILALNGCTMAPKYTRPAAPVPAQWPVGVAYDAGATPTNAVSAPGLGWDQFFSDDKLRQLISRSLQNNRDLRVAVLNVERARALYRIQRNELLPAASVAAGGGRQRVPADLTASGHRETLEQWSIDFGVFAWEPDFFGRIRSLKDRALQEYLATEQASRSTQILLISSVANTYLALAADQENLRLSETTLVAQQDSLDLVKRRFDLGLTPELDVFRARAQVETARGDVARFRQLVAQDQNALNLLAGEPVPPELLPSRQDEVPPAREIAAGVPSDVLLRRPDVRQAEHLLQAAYADIGAARAAFFPRISLTATLGTASADLSGLFKSGSGTWSYAPQIVMPIFDTRTWAALRTTKVQRELALTQYEGAIQTAFREVADALAVRGTVDQQVQAQTALVEAVAETYRLSNFRYETGLDDYLSVLDAQRSLYLAQQGLVSLRRAKLANQVQLYAVLGGGWGPEPETEAGRLASVRLPGQPAIGSQDLGAREERKTTQCVFIRQRRFSPASVS
jgi:multidrug efflux system outer membrane protein